MQRPLVTQKNTGELLISIEMELDFYLLQEAWIQKYLEIWDRRWRVKGEPV